MPSLQLREAQARFDLLEVTGYDVSLDLTRDESTFGSTTRIGFTSHGGETFLDVKPVELRAAHLNGQPLDVTLLADGRLPLPRTEGVNELVVEAVMGYRNDGEGLHRAVDPADGRAYVYGMSFLDAGPSIFACFDQPDLKAPFTLHVTAPEDWVVVGNGRAERVGAGRWELATTPPLSTYFVTLVAGPYHQVTTEHDGILLGLETRASLASHLDRDAEELFGVTRACFDEYHRLFGIRYAFGDYHQAFVPEFNAGAMENPGCVTLRDPYVFTSHVTRDERLFRAEVIAHEMAHQWFGNLVSMKWWDDLWLNESFAEYMGARVTATVTEYTDMWVQDAFSRRPWGLLADQGSSTHPVAGSGARDATSALQDFDGISYAKGAAVLKQLNHRLGDEVFLGGAVDHFERHRFGNATMADLFSSWERAGAVDLSDWVSSWLRTAGPDRITVDRASGEIVRTPPAAHPAERTHDFEVAVRSAQDAWQRDRVTLSEARTPLPGGPLGHDAAVVLDPGEETWAVFTLDETTASLLPELFPSVTDPLMRASVWGAVRNGLDNAVLPLDRALQIAVAGLPVEDTDVGLMRLSYLVLQKVVAWSHRREEAREQVHRALRTRLASADPGSGVQLGAFRGVVASCGDASTVRDWLAQRDLPPGLDVDRDLRWRLLTRLAALGGTDRAALGSALDADPSTESRVDHAAAVAALPEAEAKAWAWRCFTGEERLSNYELEAAGLSMWRQGQEHVTAPYVERYFAEVAGLADVHRGWVLGDVVESFFPRYSYTRSTLERSRAVIATDGLDLTVRRKLVDATDQLARAVAAR